MNVYVEKGYKNRKDYLDNLAENYNVTVEAVYALAVLLGSEEDFDGLIVAIENLEEYI